MEVLIVHAFYVPDCDAVVVGDDGHNGHSGAGGLLGVGLLVVLGGDSGNEKRTEEHHFSFFYHSTRFFNPVSKIKINFHKRLFSKNRSPFIANLHYLYPSTSQTPKSDFYL